MKKLRSQGLIEHYDQVIQDQIKEGIVERVMGSATGQCHFYIPHKGVLHDSAATTKLQVVYDASARAHSGAPSLNECLNPRPPLQNKLWSVLVRAPFHPGRSGCNYKNNWPPDIVANPCQETLPEAKATQDVFAMAVAETDELDMLLEKFSYWKVMRMCAWIMRFTATLVQRK